MSFKGIFGQEKPVAFLKSAMERGRVSHAYLFSGLGGVGKRTTAEIFARALNCREAPLDACGRCASCLRMIRGNHPDLSVLKPEGQFIRIQGVRELQKQMRFKPSGDGKRVFILVDAERMNSAAANALLKTLEEPAPSNILILVSSRPHQLPLTILSRCQILRFNPLDRDQITSFLAERLKMERGTAAVLAASAAGSIGKALELHKDAYLKVREDILRRVAAFTEEDPLKALSLVEVLGKEREALLEGLDVLKTWYRDVLVYRETGESDKLIHRDHLESLKVFAERMAAPDILRNIKTVSRAGSAVERNANKQLTLEIMLFRLVHPYS